MKPEAIAVGVVVGVGLAANLLAHQLRPGAKAMALPWAAWLVMAACLVRVAS